MTTALTKPTPALTLPAEIEPGWLAEQKPWAVEAAAEVLLEQRFGLVHGVEETQDPRTKVRYYRVGWKKTQNASSLSRSTDWAGALELLEQCFAPAPDDVLEAALAELSVQVRHFGGSEERADLQLGVYVKNLRQYPADIVMNELALWPRVSKPRERGKDLAREWPEWFDLESVIRASCARRRQWLDDMRALDKTAGKKRSA